MIGVGSMFFHASLRYSMQLLDEFPMLWYSLACSSSLLLRLRGLQLAVPAGVLGMGLTCAVLLTEQHSFLHEVARGLMSCTFAICLVVISWGVTAVSVRLKQDITGKRRRVPVLAERVHLVSFVMFVLAVMCWLVDNYFCPALWALPLGVPYPHLHTWWHLLTG